MEFCLSVHCYRACVKLNSGREEGEREREEGIGYTRPLLPAKMLLVPFVLLSLAGSFDCPDHVIFTACLTLRGHDTHIDFSSGFCLWSTGFAI